MPIECEDCLALPICINRIQFIPEASFSYGYSIVFESMKYCDYVHRSVTMGHFEYHRVKKFFLIKKGMIKDDPLC